MTDASGIATAGRALEHAGIAWAILRLTFDPNRPLGDVDVLVEPAGIDRAADVLRGLDFIRLPWTDGSSRGVLRYDAANDGWLWLDLQDQLVFGGRRLSEATVREVLARRRRAADLALLDPGDEFWVILARTLLEGRSLEGRHRDRLTVLVEDVPDDAAPIARWIDEIRQRPGLAARSRELVAEGSWTALRELGPGRPAGRPARAAGRRLRAIAHALPRLLTPRGRRAPSVALLGPDGAGKSTLALTLEDRYPFATRRIYMGVGPPPGTPRKRFLLAASASAAGLLLQWWRFLTGRYHQYRGRLVIFDRYMEDPWLPLPPGASVARRIGRRVRSAISCPPADLMVVLDAPGAAMFGRKGEHSAGLLEAQRERYLRLGDRVPNVIVVDTTAGAEAVARRVAGLLWERLVATWGGASAKRM